MDIIFSSFRFLFLVSLVKACAQGGIASPFHDDSCLGCIPSGPWMCSDTHPNASFVIAIDGELRVRH